MISREQAESAVRSLIEYCGDDPAREGVLETPARVAKAWLELTRGLREKPPAMKSFEKGDSDQMVLVTNITFNSLCEHHFLPFTGTVDVGYLPGDRIAGLSKFARVVDHFAAKPQTQELMTADLADYMYTQLEAFGVMVVARAEHMCMSCRGVRKAGSVTVTSAIRGDFDKSEYLDLLRVVK